MISYIILNNNNNNNNNSGGHGGGGVSNNRSIFMVITLNDYKPTKYRKWVYRSDESNVLLLLLLLLLLLKFSASALPDFLMVCDVISVRLNLSSFQSNVCYLDALSQKKKKNSHPFWIQFVYV
jgi:hypothetical protein